MSPPFNFEPNYRDTMLTREEWIRGPGTSTVKWPVRSTDGSRTLGGAVAGDYGQSLGRRLTISLGKYATVFPAEIYMLSWPLLMKFKWAIDQKNTASICSDSHAVWKLFRLSKLCPHWCKSAKRHWMTFLPTILWDCSGPWTFWDTHGNEIADGLTRGGTVHQFVGLELALEVARQITRRKMKTLDWQLACDNVAGYQYSKTGSKTDLEPKSFYQN